MTRQVKGHYRNVGGKLVLVQEHQRKGDPKKQDVSAQRTGRAGWIPPTQRKGEFTTPPEARKLQAQYKKELVELKRMQDVLGGKEFALENPEYVKRLKENQERMREYMRLVKEFQEEQKKGKMFNPEDPESQYTGWEIGKTKGDKPKEKEPYVKFGDPLQKEYFSNLDKYGEETAKFIHDNRDLIAKMKENPLDNDQLNSILSLSKLSTKYESSDTTSFLLKKLKKFVDERKKDYEKPEKPKETAFEKYKKEHDVKISEDTISNVSNNIEYIIQDVLDSVKETDRGLEIKAHADINQSVDRLNEVFSLLDKKIKEQKDPENKKYYEKTKNELKDQLDYSFGNFAYVFISENKDNYKKIMDLKDQWSKYTGKNTEKSIKEAVFHWRRDAGLDVTGESPVMEKNEVENIISTIRDYMNFPQGKGLQIIGDKVVYTPLHGYTEGTYVDGISIGAFNADFVKKWVYQYGDDKVDELFKSVEKKPKKPIYKPKEKEPTEEERSAMRKQLETYRKQITDAYHEKDSKKAEKLKGEMSALLKKLQEMKIRKKTTGGSLDPTKIEPKQVKSIEDLIREKMKKK